MIQLFGEDARSVPDWFKRRLRDIDTALVCYYNPFRMEFCIDRCIKGSDCLSSDHVACQKVNVMLFPHMGEAALDKLKSMDSWTNFGGNDEAAIARSRRKHELEKEEWDAKQKAESLDMNRHAGLENRVQLNKALHLIQQHDTARVH